MVRFGVDRRELLSLVDTISEVDAGFFDLSFDLSHPELLWVGGIGLATVVIALYYYLGVVKRIDVFEPRSQEPIAVPARMKVTLVLSVAAMIFVGIAPQFLERSATAVVRELATASAKR